MGLAKESMASVQPCALKEKMLGDISSPGFYVIEEGDGSEKTDGPVKSIAMSCASSPSSANSDEYAFRAENYHQPAEEVHSLINFNSGYENFMHVNTSSLLSFEQNERVSQNGNFLRAASHKDDSTLWEANRWNQISPRYNTDLRLMEDINCFDTASNYGFMIGNSTKENHGDWIYSEATTFTDCILESGSQNLGSLKRPYTELGESMQILKKQCASSSSKKPKPKTVPSKDPQSIAAKNRRERISERLKILQELVPNGSKVDLVTMLEKAISYVKFLQLQVKVLATDEFWPAAGGKAPDISQVRNAIDAILSSQKDRSSSSSK